MSACQLDNVTKIFKTNKGTCHALKEISLTIEEGELFMITGPSCAGKSTLLSVIGGLMPPTGGACTIHRTNLYALSEKESAEFRLRHIGYVFQTPHLISSMTIFENLLVPTYLMGLREQLGKQRAVEILDQLGMNSHIESFPEELSEGEKALVALGRALMLLPKVLILDEPTDNLDHALGVKVCTFLKEIASDHGITVIMANSDVRLHPFADRVAKMQEGKIVMLAGESLALENEPPFLKL